MERTISESHSGGSSDAPHGTTPATPPAARVTAQPTQNSKKAFLSALADWFYSAYALVTNEFLLEVFFGLCWSMS
jgi:hypothetical protein